MLPYWLPCTGLYTPRGYLSSTPLDQFAGKPVATPTYTDPLESPDNQVRPPPRGSHSPPLSPCAVAVDRLS